MHKIKLELSNKLASSEILLHLGLGGAYPISRFPRSLLQDEEPIHSQSFLFTSNNHLHSANHYLSSAAIRQQLVVNSNRWAGRTPSQQLRRQAWTPPDLARRPKPSNSISRYSDPNFVIGNSSPGVLRRITNRLINGPSPAPNLPEESSSGNIIPKDSTEDIRQKFVQAEGDGSQEDDRPFGGWIPELDSTPMDEPAELGDTAKPIFKLPGSIDTPEMPASWDYGQGF